MRRRTVRKRRIQLGDFILAKILDEPARYFDRRTDPVRRLSPTVPLVGKHHQLYRYAPLLQILDHLLRLHHWNIRIVGTVQHYGGGFDVLDFIDGG